MQLGGLLTEEEGREAEPRPRAQEEDEEQREAEQDRYGWRRGRVDDAGPSDDWSNINNQVSKVRSIHYSE